MNINPFELLKNFGNIQSKMTEVQGKLAAVRVTGSAGGDMVKVEINGHFEVLSVSISPEAAGPNDIEMLQDLTRAAMTDALHKIKEAIRSEMSALTGGLNIPPGFMGMT
ncbi:MAG: YbaB/EbfC family nucleoid-associated protein [Spirochaetales bacterium]|jgi:DNA-binding YbaB/EbfC family protein|nr:YbaB/EbfC family nucleoid-associated protein [Spirochaetales bacterium]